MGGGGGGGGFTSKHSSTPRHTHLRLTHHLTFSVVLELFSVPGYSNWLTVFVLLHLRVPFEYGRLSAIKVQLELRGLLYLVYFQGWGESVGIRQQMVGGSGGEGLVVGGSLSTWSCLGSNHCPSVSEPKAALHSWSTTWMFGVALIPDLEGLNTRP